MKAVYSFVTVVWFLAGSSGFMLRPTCQTTDGQDGICKSIEVCGRDQFEVIGNGHCLQRNKVCCIKRPDSATIANDNEIYHYENTNKDDHPKNDTSNHQINDTTLNDKPKDDPVTARAYNYADPVRNINLNNTEERIEGQGPSTEYPQFYDNQKCELLWKNKDTINPKVGCCGVEAFSADRIYGGNPSALGKFPWMVYLQYENKSKHIFKCAGVLISPRHVLTAGHCLKMGDGAEHEVTHVTLGVHNRTRHAVESGEGVNCPNCQRKRIEVACFDILHGHDLGLLYLASPAPYTDFIRPICMPLEDITKSSKYPNGIKFTVAGWGKTEKTVRTSPIKMELNVTYKPIDECKETIRRSAEPMLKVNKKYGDICAAGVQDQGTCIGDSGGPLMYYTGEYYELSGIIIRGATSKQCGNSVPTISSNVQKNRQWIDSHIRKWSTITPTMCQN